MRKLFVILLAAVLAAPALSGQVAPDNDDIFEQTINNESPYYYPALMLRYNSGDTTLTEKDYYYLYYGYAFSDDYHPLAPIPAEDKVLMLSRRRMATLPRKTCATSSVTRRR